MIDRIEKARQILSKMEIDKANGVLSNEDELEIKGRLLNIVLRCYDIPLQGSTTNTYKPETVLPTPQSFVRSEFHKIW
jgi:hypothetical protein